MKKIVIEKPGSYDRLLLKEFPTPKPGPGQILIETQACGVNFADCCVRMGVYRSAKEFVGWPITPGFEVAGIIAAIGDGVTKFQVGQRVVAVTLFGGYATHLIVPETSAKLIPENIDFISAASIPTIFLTAKYGLDLANPKKGEIILVHSAAGGVGMALVQMAKMRGCHSVGVVGAPHKIDAVRNLGALAVIDKSKQDLWKEAEKLSPKGYDVIFDANGIETLDQSYHHLSLGGKLVVYGFHTMFSKGRGKPNWLKMMWDYLRTPKFNPLNMTNDNHSVLAYNLSYLTKNKELFETSFQHILELVKDKKLTLPPIKTYSLENACEAHRALESGNTVGKLILTPQ